MISSQSKKDIFTKFGGNSINTGSAESQIALFTERITQLTAHLKVMPKDHPTKHSLIKLVGKRRSQLDFLQKTDITRYRKILNDLSIRK